MQAASVASRQALFTPSPMQRWPLGQSRSCSQVRWHSLNAHTSAEGQSLARTQEPPGPSPEPPAPPEVLMPMLVEPAAFVVEPLRLVEPAALVAPAIDDEA